MWGKFCRTSNRIAKGVFELEVLLTAEKVSWEGRMVEVHIQPFSLGSISITGYSEKKITTLPSDIAQLFLTLLPVSAQRDTVINASSYSNSVFIRHQTLMQPTEGLYLHKLCMLLVDTFRYAGLLHLVQTEAVEPSFPFCFRCWESLWHDQEVQ